MTNSIGYGLAVVATASLGFAMPTGEGVDKKNPDGTPRTSGASLWQESGPRITFRAGEGISIESEDAMLRIRGELQARLYFDSVEAADGGSGADLSPSTDVLSFAARRARTKFDGYVWNEDITYYLRLDHAGSNSVLDVNAAWRILNTDDGYVNIRMGTQKFRDSLQFSTDNTLLEFNERALATRTFSELRGTGALVEGGFIKGEGDEHKLLWHVGAMNNDIAQGNSGVAAPNALAGNSDNVLFYNFGLAFAPQGATVNAEGMHTEGDLEHSGNLKSIFGANLVYGSTRVPGVQWDTTTINLYAAANLGNGIAVQGEYFMRSDEPDGGTEADSNGFYVQGSYTTKRNGDEGTQWGVGGRFSMVDLDDAQPAMRPVASGPAIRGAAAFAQGTVTEIQGVVSAYYHKHALRTQVMYTFQNLDPQGGGETDNHGIDILFTLLF